MPILELDAPHPDLVRGDAVPHVWLGLEVETTLPDPTLHAEWIQMENRPMWDFRLTLSELTAK
ncbi:hypothetical protein GC197_06435 [bacterium]|nr:hypothetical protein [bacterium]